MYNYLKFDAASIQQLLQEKLYSSGLYTDQLYPGSDTKILIDLFSWTFGVLTYIMNNNAANAIFQDVQLYENLNRIVKLLSYKPRGYLTANAPFSIQTSDIMFVQQNKIGDICTIPKFSYIQTSNTDSNGNPVCYSFINDFTFNTYSYKNIDGTYNTYVITPRSWPILYNGKFKKYNNEFTATGIPYETFLIAGLGPDIPNTTPAFLDHNNFHVYIQTTDINSSKSVFVEWTQVNSLVLDATYNSTAFQLRLNQNKLYVLKFGDNVHGKQLYPGDTIHIVYLLSNGQAGQIDVSQLQSSVIKLNIEGFSDTMSMLNVCFNGIESFTKTYSGLFLNNGMFVSQIQSLKLVNTQKSTSPYDYEEINSIKEYAPSFFRMGNRLITINDFTNYIKNVYYNNINDVWVCNNIEYTTIFYNWLLKYGVLNINIIQDGYLYSNACSFNNVYIWLLPNNTLQVSTNLKNIIIEDCNKIKCVTAQIIPLNGILTHFIPYIQNENFLLDIMNIQSYKQQFSKIKIKLIKRANAFISNQKIIEQVNLIITNYFKNKKLVFGSIINLGEIQQQILNLGYIQSIKTVNIMDESDIKWVQGLSFAAFTPLLINNNDFQIFTQSKQLLPFQYASLYSQSLINQIEIENDNSFKI